MENKINTQKENMKLTRYRLEASVQDVTQNGKDYLAAQIRDVLESNKPYQNKCDYIGYSILSIDEKIDLIDEEMNSLKAYKARLKEAKAISLQTAAKVLNEYGITKIEGAGISSITVTNVIETTKLEVEVLNEQELINQGFYKKVLDEKKILESYVDGNFKELIESYANINKVLYIKPASLRINKRRTSKEEFINDEFNDDMA